MKKVIVFIIVFCFIAAIAGCTPGQTTGGTTTTAGQTTTTTSGTTTEPTDGSGLPIVEDSITLTYWVGFGGWEATTMNSNAEKGCYIEKEKLTNIKIEWLHPAAGQEQTQFNLLFTSNDMPDMIEGYSRTYPGGPDKAVEDGYYLKLNDLIEEHAPNYKRLRDMSPDIAKQTITDAGNIYVFVCLQPDKEVPWYGMLTRQDWLDQLDLDIPVTIADWYNMLQAYKTLDGVEYPLQYNPNTFWGGMFISAYGIGASFYQDNGTVHFGYTRPEFKDWLTELAKWYDEGLLDKDYATRDGKSRDEMIISGKTGAFVNDGWPLYYNALDVAGEGQLVAAPHPVMQEGQKLRYRQTDTHVKSSGTVISTSCEYPVEAVKWMDFNYSELGFMLFNYGIENESYVLVDGELDLPEVWASLIPNLWGSGKVPQFTEEITNSPEGYDFYTAAMRYKVHIGSYLRNFRAVEREPDFFWEARYETWVQAGDDMVLPPLTFTAEESLRIGEIMGEVNTYYDEMVNKFIMGVEPLSKYDEYVARINAMGIDEAIAIYQTALDRYNQR